MEKISNRTLYLWLIFILNINCPLIAQNNPLDSLKEELNNSAKDTSKVSLYLKISDLMKDQNQNEALDYANKGIVLAKELNSKPSIAASLRQIAKIYCRMNQIDNFNENLNQAIEVYYSIDDKLNVSKCYGDFGRFYGQNKEYNKALAYFTKALNISVEIGDKKGEAKFMGNIGTAYEKMLNYQQAVEYHLKEVNILESISANKNDLAVAYKSVGANYMFLYKNKDSRYYFSKALKLFEELGNKYESAGIPLDIGNTYLNGSEYNIGIEYFNLSLKRGKEINNKTIIAMSYNNLGKCYFNLSDYPVALENFLSALKIAEEFGPQGLSGVAAHSGNIGVIYYTQKNYQKAKEYAERSLKINLENGYISQYATNLTNLGNIYKQTGKYDIALNYYKKALRINDSLQKKISSVIDLINIGDVYHLQDNIDKALEYYSKAYDLSKEIDDPKGISSSLFLMGEAYAHGNKDDKALPFMETAAELAKQCNNKETLMSIYSKLSDYYKKKGNPLKSLEYKSMYLDIKDSVFNLESSNKIADIMLQYEKDKSEKAKKVLQTENKLKQVEISHQKVLRNYLVIISGLIFILAIGIFRRYYFKKKQNKLLENKNIELQKAYEEIDRNYSEKLELQQQTHEKETQISNLKNEILQSQLDQKQKELFTTTMNLVDKNEYLIDLKEKIDKISKTKPDLMPEHARGIARSINLKVNSEETWQAFETQFTAIHYGFMDYLIQNYPDLSPMELKVCSLIKINLSSKEIASLLNIGVRTVEDHRLNIRKKLGLTKDDNLNQFIVSLIQSK